MRKDNICASSVLPEAVTAGLLRVVEGAGGSDHNGQTQQFAAIGLPADPQDVPADR